MVGVKRVMRYLPPVVTGPVIICIGLSLAGSAINNASTNWFLALVALAVIIIFNIWGKGMFKIIPILMGVVIAYAVAVVLNALGIKNPDGSVIINFAGCTGRHRRTSAAAALQIRSDQHYDHGTDRDRDHDGACRRYVGDLCNRRRELPF